MLFHKLKNKNEDKSNLDRWLLTYADMITLLLALFIVMYSMSYIDSGKFSKVTQALANQLKGGSTLFEKSLGSSIIGSKVLNIGELRILEKKLMNNVNLINKRLPAPLGISTKIDERGLVIHIKESALFAPGQDKLKNEAFEALDVIATQLVDITNPIRIEGHTDNMPINTERFPSNWELSASRAINVVKYLIENHNIPPTKISALGYGEFRPLAENTTPEGRAQNRRVDIVVLSNAEIINEPPGLPTEFVEEDSQE